MPARHSLRQIGVLVSQKFFTWSRVKALISYIFFVKLQCNTILKFLIKRSSHELLEREIDVDR